MTTISPAEAPNPAPAEAPNPTVGPGSGPMPLIALLTKTRDVFMNDFAARLATSDFADLSLAHATNVLRHLAGGPLRASQIVTQCGVTKQAVSQQIVHLERNGYLAVEHDPADHRARILRLTPSGEKALHCVEQTFADIERDWIQTLGARDGASLRRALSLIAQSAAKPT